MGGRESPGNFRCPSGSVRRGNPGGISVFARVLSGSWTQHPTVCSSLQLSDPPKKTHTNTWDSDYCSPRSIRELMINGYRICSSAGCMPGNDIDGAQRKPKAQTSTVSFQMLRTPRSLKWINSLSRPAEAHALDGVEALNHPWLGYCPPYSNSL